MRARHPRPRSSAFRLPSSVVALCLVALCLPAPALAQSPIDRLVGKPVAQVRILLQGRETADPEIDRVLETTTGVSLSTSEVRESIVHLMALGRFEDVRVSADEVERGVRLTYDLTPLRSVKGVDFRGQVVLSPRQLRNEVTNRYGASPPAARGQEMARALEAYYHDRGFLAAGATPRVEARPGQRYSTLVFDVSAGQRAAVGAVEVQATPEAAAAGVLQRLGLVRGLPYDPSALHDRVAAYLDELRGRGFIEAKLEVEPGLSGDGGIVDMNVRLSRGPHVTIAFRGDPLPPNRRNELTALRSGGAVDEDLLESEQWRLEDELRGQGFRDAQVRLDREQRGPDEVAVVFTVRRGPQYRVGRVQITGNQHLARAAIQPSLRLAAGQWFVKSRLDGDVATITERYRADGFAGVKVEATATPEAGMQASLDVLIAVAEGPQTRIEGIEFAGNAALGTPMLRQEVRLRNGAPYYPPDVGADRDAVLAAYLSRGYQLADVDVEPVFTPDRTRVTLKFAISEGPQIRIDHVLVVGNVRTRAEVIERETGLRRGMALSFLRLSDAQARLSALGLFRRVQVTELQRGSETERDVLVVVEEAQPNTIGYGGGLEMFRRPKTDPVTGVSDRVYDVVPRGFVEYGRRNLWGKNRSFNVFARAAIRSSSLNDQDGSADGSGFREYRLLGTYREPRLFDLAVDLGASAVTEQASRPSFDLERRQVVVEASHRFGRTITTSGRYTLGRTRLFNEKYSQRDKLLIDRVYGESGVLISSFSTSITRNTRDDAAEPTRGTLLLLDGTLASQKFGSDVGFLRGFAQGFAYRSVPKLPGTVLAVGARLGLVTGLARLIPQLDSSGHQIIGPDGKPVLVRNVDVPASERFFAGGDNSVRGWDQDQLGAAGVLDDSGVSQGGNALVIFNAELRFPLLQRLGLNGAAFVDVGNVFKRVNDVDLGELRTGFGVGLRWRSPVGPFRIDFGWKATQHRFGNGVLEPRFEWPPYISIGQSF